MHTYFWLKYRCSYLVRQIVSLLCNFEHFWVLVGKVITDWVVQCLLFGLFLLVFSSVFFCLLLFITSQLTVCHLLSYFHDLATILGLDITDFLFLRFLIFDHSLSNARDWVFQIIGSGIGLNLWQRLWNWHQLLQSSWVNMLLSNHHDFWSSFLLLLYNFNLFGLGRFLYNICFLCF